MLADLVVLTASFLVAASLLRRLPTRDWFHPFGFPLLYLAVSIGLPLAYVSTTGRTVAQLSAAGVTPRLILLCAGAVVSLWAGGALGSARMALPAQRYPQAGFSYERARAIGLVLLIGLIGAGLWLAVMLRGSPYGSEQGTYSFTSFLEATVEVVAVPAVALVVSAGANRRGRILWRDLGAVGLLGVLMLVGGDRATPLALIILVAFIHHETVRRLRWQTVAVGVATVLVLLTAVAFWRARSGPSDHSVSTLIAPAAASTGSPVGTTARLLQVVPAETSYYGGATYLAAGRYLLPGPIARTLFGAPSATGSFVYRELLGLHDPSQGYGFSFEAEAYLNFGTIGVMGAFGLLGLLLMWAWRQRRPDAQRARDLLRTDALGQVKMVLYGLMILYVALRACRRRLPAVAWGRGWQGWQMSSELVRRSGGPCVGPAKTLPGRA
jgi:hypothetical protein